MHLVGFIITKLKCSMSGSFETFHQISDDADLGDSTLVDEVRRHGMVQRMYEELLSRIWRRTGFFSIKGPSY